MKHLAHIRNIGQGKTLISRVLAIENLLKHFTPINNT